MRQSASNMWERECSKKQTDDTKRFYDWKYRGGMHSGRDEGKKLIWKRKTDQEPVDLQLEACRLFMDTFYGCLRCSPECMHLFFPSGTHSIIINGHSPGEPSKIQEYFNESLSGAFLLPQSFRYSYQKNWILLWTEGIVYQNQKERPFRHHFVLRQHDNPSGAYSLHSAQFLQ